MNPKIAFITTRCDHYNLKLFELLAKKYEIHFYFTGGGDHFRIVVISSVFQGKTLIDQHRLVQASIHEALEDGRIHAVHIKTFTPEMWAKKRSEGDNLQVL